MTRGGSLKSNEFDTSTDMLGITVPSMRGAWIAGGVAALALTIGVQTAAAEAQMVQRTDPKAESPAGVIYQIPLDSARRDAAPVLPSGRRDGGVGGPGAGGAGGSGGGSGGQAGSSGSGGSASGGGRGASGSGGASAPPPGGSGHGGGNGAALSASAADGGGTPQDPSSIHSENGFGSSSQVPGVSQAALRTGAGVAATRAAGSTLPTYLLLILIALAAIGIGVFAARRHRHSDGGRAPTGFL